MLTLIPLVPLFPLLGFLFCGLAGPFVPRRYVHMVACGSVALSLLVGAVAVVELAGGLDGYRTGGSITVDPESRRFEIEPWRWIALGPSSAEGGRASGAWVPFGFQLDPLSAVMLLVVTGVGLLIHIYSIGYMAHEEGVPRFFAYLNLFTAMMLVLVLGNNFLVMFIGWEGVGLCSYLLIGFYTDRLFDPQTGMTCADAGRKAFIVNRIGDFGFLLGVLLLLTQFGTLDFSTVMAAINTDSAAWYGAGLLTVAGILLFVGACGKSAQIPLFVWLPDAMAGPTPVSALIHAATMVTAGIYMLSRCSAVFWHSPTAMAVVAVVGCSTAILAATIGICQNDIKKVLAYSTVSQLGYMFLGAGVGAFVASIFHLMTHAFFKACLFLGSGSVIHAMGGDQDVRRMGGLRRWMPATYWTFLIATLAIAGIPPLSGFFSKDEILTWSLTSHRGGFALWLTGVVAAGITAFYMFRLVYMTFHGRFRGTPEQEHHIHESPRTMTVPLQILAALAIVGGFLGVPKVLSLGADVNVIDHWLEPVVAYHGVEPAAHRAALWAPPPVAPRGGGEPESAAGGPAGHAGEGEGGSSVQGTAHIPLSAEWGLVLLAVLISLAGIGVARAFYGTEGSTLPQRAAAALGPVYRMVARKYWVDELYDLLIVRPYYALCAVSDWADRWLVDGAVNGTRHVTVGASHVSNGFDRWGVDLAVNGIAYAFRGCSWVFRRLQSGLVQTYAAAMIFGTFVLLSLYLILWK